MPSSSSSSSSSDSDSDKKKVAAKPAAAAVPAAKPAAAKKASSSSDSDDDKPAAKPAAAVPAATKAKVVAANNKAKAASSSSSSSSDSDAKPAAKPAAAAPKAAAAPAKKAASSSSSSSSDSDDDKKKKPAAAAAAVPAKAAAPAKKKDSSSSSSSSDSDDDKKPAAAGAKRKTEEEKPAAGDDAELPVKKQKASNGEAVATKTSGEAAATNGDASGEVKAIFVGGLPWTATEDEVSAFFKDCGKVVSCRIPLRPEDGKSKGMAFVEFDTAAAANKAVELNGADMGGRWLKIVLSTTPPKGDKPARQTELSAKPAGCKTCFLGNLSFQVTEDQLREVFASCGTVTSVRIATHADTGNPRGFGHVEFEEDDAVDKAVKLAGTDVAGRPIRVDFAGGKERDSATGGRGGARGGFGGGRGRGGGFGGDRGGRGGRGGFGGRGGRGGRGGFNEAKAKSSGALPPGGASGANKKMTFD